MNHFEFRYRLRQEEMEEALLCLNWRREGKWKNLNLGILTLVGVWLLILYVRNPDVFLFFLLLVLVVLLLFVLTYGAKFRMHRQAANIVGKAGEYRIIIDNDIVKYGDNPDSLKLKGGKAEFFSSDSVFVLRVNGLMFVIPKRMVNREQESALQEWAGIYCKKIINVRIRKGKEGIF